jgi:hypothetical protein
MESSNAKSLIQYMYDKYRSIDIMPCPGGCGHKTIDPQLTYGQNQVVTQPRVPTLEGTKDTDFIMVKYTTQNTGDHNVLGASIIGGKHINYGYRSGGDIFLVHKSDVALQPNLFQPVEMETPLAAKPVRDVPKEDPVVIDKSVPDLSKEAEAEPEAVEAKPSTGYQPIPLEKFLTEAMATRMKENGMESAQEISDAGLGVLTGMKGIGTSRAQLILDAANKALGK